tara:strand:- start:33422 stop:34171 length:750 start_codon:yes stop_codon:yes gene_type:complete
MGSRKLIQSVGDYRIDLALGKVAGSMAGGAYGLRYGINNNDVEDIWCGVDPVRTDLLSPERLLIVSDSDDDTFGAGTGAEVLIITGLDGDWREITEVVLMNGTNEVVTVNTFLRVNRVIVNAEVDDANQGDITLHSELTGHQQGGCTPHEGWMASTHYAVPVGHTAVLHNVSVATNKNDEAEMLLKMRIPEASGRAYATILHVPIGLSNGGLTGIAQPFPAKSDIKFQCRSLKANVTCSAVYSWYLIPN